jgi:SSS family solute:Na+ symporter
MYNEVIQFALIILGLLPLVFFMLRDFHGVAGVASHLQPSMRHTWVGLLVAVRKHLAWMFSASRWCSALS